MNAPIPKTTAFSHQAAKFSWVCPIIVMLVMTFTQQIGHRVIIEMISLLLFLVSLVFGIIALFGIRAHGKSGILAPAIAGIIINGLLVVIFVTNFMAARARAQQQRGDVTAPIEHSRQVYTTWVPGMRGSESSQRAPVAIVASRGRDC